MTAPDGPERGGRYWTLRTPLTLMAALIGLLVASPVLPRWLIRESPLARPDAILSLGSHERERFSETAAQARQWPAAVVLLTTPRVVGRYNCDACPHRVGWLATLGIPAGRVRLLSAPVVNTNDELIAAAAWMRQHRVARLQIVTSPYHTRRVQVLARAALQGLQVGVVACRVAGGLPALWWTRHYDRFYVRYELAALLAGWWRYGLAPWRLASPRP